MAPEVFTRELKDFGDSLWSMKSENKFCDAAIIIDGQRIEVHAVILASASQYFENAFKNSDIGIKEVSFKNIDTEALLALVEFCYTGSITITESNVNRVFKMAKYLSMEAIIAKSSKVLKNVLNVENSLSMLKIVKSAKSKILISTVLDYMRKHFEEVSLLQDFLDLEYSDMKELLNGDVDAAAVTVYEALKKWGKHDISRTINFVDLLDQIKLESSLRENLLLESQSVLSSNNDFSLKFNKTPTLECLKSNHDSLRNSSSDTLIAIGDDGYKFSKVVEILNLDNNEWIEIKNEESRKISFSAILIEDKLTIIGGFNRGSALDTVEYINLNTQETKNLQPLKCARFNSSAVKYGDYIYVIGGFKSCILPSMERWDQYSNTWTNVEPMANPRHRFGVAVLGNRIFAVGGKGELDILSDVEAYEPIANKWRRITPMNERRAGHGVAEVNGFLYAVGGENENGKLKTAERYDPNIKKWTMIQSLEVPRNGLAAGNLNGQLVITGGWSNSAVSTVEMYDEETNKWKSMPSLKKCRSNHNLVQIPWKLAKNIFSKRVPI